MNQEEYMKAMEAIYEEALKMLIASSNSDFVDWLEMQIRAYVKTLKELQAVNDMISGGSTITTKEERFKNQNK